MLFQLNDNLCELLGITRSVTAAYHPQTNGLDEKTNHNIKRQVYLSTFCTAQSSSYT